MSGPSGTTPRSWASPAALNSTRWGRGSCRGPPWCSVQLPKSLAELDEIADAVTRHADPGVVLLAGGRVKHMSLGMNSVLERHFSEVQPQRARQKSRILLARGPQAHHGRPAASRSPRPTRSSDLTVCARGAVFAGHRAGYRHPVPAGVPAADAAGTARHRSRLRHRDPCRDVRPRQPRVPGHGHRPVRGRRRLRPGRRRKPTASPVRLWHSRTTPWVRCRMPAPI